MHDKRDNFGSRYYLIRLNERSEARAIRKKREVDVSRPVEEVPEEKYLTSFPQYWNFPSFNANFYEDKRNISILIRIYIILYIVYTYI